jgi:hypothetical protein
MINIPYRYTTVIYHILQALKNLLKIKFLCSTSEEKTSTTITVECPKDNKFVKIPSLFTHHLQDSTPQVRPDLSYWPFDKMS